MATVVERPVHGYATLEDALGGVFGKMEELERGQQRLQEGQERLQEGQERLQRGLEALAEAHGSRLERLERGQQRLQEGQRRMQGGLEALAEAHGNFATKVLTILGRESQGDKAAPPGTNTVTSRSSS